MLGPKFREGQTLTASQSVVIALPEDNSYPMELLCYVLHLRSISLPEKLGIEDIVDVSNIANKYICQEAIQTAAFLWLNDPRNCYTMKEDPSTLGRVLTIYFQLGLDKKCNSIARRILLNSTYYTPITDDHKTYYVEVGETPWLTLRMF